MTVINSKEKKTALIVGATGLVGRHLLDQLLKDDRYERVTALVRKPLDLHDDKFSEVIIDFDQQESYASWFSKVDTVFCCLGTTIRNAGSQEAFRRVDYTYPLSMAKVAAASGADTFVCVTALSADPHSRIFYNRIKGETEQAISSLTIPSIIFIRPSLLLGDRQEVRVGERLAILTAKALGFIFRGALKKYKGVTAQAVAAAMVHYANSGLRGISIITSDQIQEFEK